MFSKLHLFVSLSREFSRYMKTFAAGFTLVHTVLHDVSIAGVQSETISFKIENASGRNEVYVDENPALNCWCSVSRYMKIKIETVQ